MTGLLSPLIYFVIYLNFFLITMFIVTKMNLFSVLYGSIQLFVVLLFTYFIVIMQGVNKMIDIVTNRMFDTFNYFAPNENNYSYSTMDSIEQPQNYKLKLHKYREKQLYDIKENIPLISTPLGRPTIGLSCDYCNTTITKKSLVNETKQKLAFRNILDYRIEQENNSLLKRTFSHLYQVYQLKKFYYPQITKIVLHDDRLKRAIEKTTIQQYKDTDKNNDEFYDDLLKTNEKRAKKLLYDMRSTLSDFLLRFTSWVLYKLLPCFLSCVVAHPGQIEMLQNASKTNLPLIFLPLHRSHLDYILISFILLNNNVRSPLVAAGDNLRIPFFGSLLRGLGAFFIKRRIDPVMGRKDYVYKALLHTYMNECLKAGHNIEFFLEGGRTRTGKPCMPKYGILSVIIEAYMDGTIDDALLVPVSVNYEKLVDGNFIREQLGQPKQMETFGAAIKGIWHVLNSDYGMMRIDFNQPFSLKELVRTFNTNSDLLPLNNINNHMKLLRSNPSTNSLYGTDVISDEHKSLVESISKHIIYDCAKTTSVMSTNIIAFLLLTKFRNGTTVDKLINALDELRCDLNDSNKNIGFTGDSIDVIHYAIDVLGPDLIIKENNLIKPIIILPNVIELSYYSNTLITHYALDSLIAIGIDFIKNNDDNTLNYYDLIDTILHLCYIFQYEFILSKPCQNLERVIINKIDDLSYKYELFYEKDDDKYLNRRAKLLAEKFHDENDYNDNPKNQIVSIDIRKLKENSENYLHYMKTLLMPLIDTYSITASVLRKLIGRSLLENELIENVLDELKDIIECKTLIYEESVSVDSIKNALKLFQKWDYLECHQENKLRLYYLRDNHDNLNSVNELYEKINKFRK